MSLKFGKNRSVYYGYHACPLRYPGIKHATRPQTELVLLDDLGKMYLAAYRNNQTSKVGITFLLKKEVKNGKSGFIFKDKFFANTRYGWVI